MKKYVYRIIPRFSDFDGYKIVHHTSFLKFIEEARLQMLRDVFHEEMYELFGEDIKSLVMDLHIKYIRAIDNYQPIEVQLILKLVHNAYFLFEFEIRALDNSLFAKGYTRHCFFQNGYGILLSYPMPFLDKLRKILREKKLEYVLEEL